METCRGIDVSSFQDAQDWNARKAEGVVFAFAKATEGQRSKDDRFAAHIRGIKAAGLVPGAYHFGWPNQDVATEAANYIATVRPYAGKGFTHWLDLERYSDGRNYAGRSATQINAWVAKWVDLVSEAFPGQRVGIYTSADDISAGRVPAGLPLWYPAYKWGYTAVSYAKAEAATKPAPSGRAPLFWQFTSTPIDRSICYLSEAGLRAWAAGTTTEEEDVALTTDDINKIAAAVVAKLVAGDGVLENSDLDRVWARDTVPAARPPYANADFSTNPTWSPKYALQTAVEGIREAVARLAELQKAVGAVGTGGMADQVAAELNSLDITFSVKETKQ